MAGKATTKKTELDEAIVDKEIVEASKKQASSKKVAKKYGPSDLIECRSITGGELVLIGDKSKLQYTWADYGDIAYVEYQDLQALQSRKSGFLVKPRFIIEDEELVEQWEAMLKPIYEKITTQTVEGFFNLPLNKFKSQLAIMPDGLKDAIKTKAVQMINSEELYDIRKVREMDAAWGTDFVAMFMQ